MENDISNKIQNSNVVYFGNFKQYILAGQLIPHIGSPFSSIHCDPLWSHSKSPSWGICVPSSIMYWRFLHLPELHKIVVRHEITYHTIVVRFRFLHIQNLLLGQSWVLHGSLVTFDSNSPNCPNGPMTPSLQRWPPCSGLGLSQNLLFVHFPPPQETVHSVFFHCPQLPLTWKSVINKN